MPRAAALLFVHNDAETIGWWIAHHAATGFDALFICDDHSTDGTLDVLTSASSLHDIRISRSDATLADRQARRKAALLDLQKQAAAEFDWTIVLAADEYLHPQNCTLQDLLNRHEKDDVILLNWCVFGLDGAQDSRGFSPLRAFTAHAPRDFPDHRVTRAFLRSGARSAELHDPLGSTERKADWSVGQIRHFAAFNLHRRAEAGDITVSPEALQHFDHNDVRLTSQDATVDAGSPLMAAIASQCLTDLHWRIKRALNPLGDHLLRDILKAHQNSPEHTCWTSIQIHGARAGELPCLLAVDDASGHALLFSTAQHASEPLSLDTCPTLSEALPLIRRSEGDYISAVSLRPVALKITAPDTSDTGHDDRTHRALARYTQLMRSGHTLAHLLGSLDTQRVPDPVALGCAIAFLPPEDARNLASMFSGLIPDMFLPRLSAL